MFKQFCSVLTLGLVVGCSSPNDPDDDPQSGGGPAATGGAAGEVGTGAMGGAGASGSVGAVGGASEATGGASEATGGASEATGGASEATGGAGLDPCGGDSETNFDGYWRRTTPGDYEDYLRIENDGGYSCSSDGKSGYSFQIEGNVVTPLGLSSVDTIEATSPDTLRLSGEEKGVLYEVDYVKTSQANYPQFCIDQEAEFSEP